MARKQGTWATPSRATARLGAVAFFYYFHSVKINKIELFSKFYLEFLINFTCTARNSFAHVYKVLVIKLIFHDVNVFVNPLNIAKRVIL